MKNYSADEMKKDAKTLENYRKKLNETNAQHAKTLELVKQLIDIIKEKDKEIARLNETHKEAMRLK